MLDHGSEHGLSDLSGLLAREGLDGRGRLGRRHEGHELVRVHQHALDTGERRGAIRGADRSEVAGVEMAAGEPELATRLAQRDHDGGRVGRAEDGLDAERIGVEERGRPVERLGAEDRIDGPGDQHGGLVRHRRRDSSATAGVESLEDAEGRIERGAFDELVKAALEHMKGVWIGHQGLLGLGLGLGVTQYGFEQLLDRADRSRQRKVTRDFDLSGSL